MTRHSPHLQVEPFSNDLARCRIAVSDVALADLRERLSRTRWPTEPEGNANWSWGTPLGFMKKAAERWANGFDWRAAEAALNRFPNWIARVIGEDGQAHEIHVVHERGSGPKPMPLVLSHGWPSSWFEFMDVVDRLAHPERFGGSAKDAFDVVLISAPNHGFSSKAARPPGSAAAADLWQRIMTGVLGYPKYAAHGGDWGSSVVSQLARRHPESLIGLHLNFISLQPTVKHPTQPPITAEEGEWIAAIRKWQARESGYSHIQATKPMTIGYGLNDSPIGLAAWMIEKYLGWGDAESSSDAGLLARHPLDQLLTQTSILWFGESLHSSDLLYRAGALERKGKLGPGERINVPTGFADFGSPRVPPTPRAWVARMFDLRTYRRYPRGGHFPALAEPELLVEELRGFFRGLR